MKKSIIVGWVGIWITGGAYAVNCCVCDWGINPTPRYAANCTDTSFCNGCTFGTITSKIVNGVCTPECTTGGTGPIIPIDPIESCKQNQYKIAKRCVDCPNGGTTHNLGGGSDITDCYIPSGTQFSDSTGTGIYTGNCNYSK